MHVGDEELVTTPGHPFFIYGHGFEYAGNLRAGDILVNVNGDKVVLEKVQHEILESPVKVYNFEVEDFHTYFVGEEGVWVHNICGTKPTANTLGKRGEDAVAKTFNITKNKRIFNINGRGRIPDFIDDNNKIIYEVKNVKAQGLTQQIKDYKELADELGYTLKIVVREGDATRISAPLRNSGIEIVNNVEF